MGGFAIAELDFQLVDAILGRFKLLHLGTEPIPISQALVELRNMLAQDSHFTFHDVPGLFGVSTDLLSLSEFMSLRCKNRLYFADASASRGPLSFRGRQLF